MLVLLTDADIPRAVPVFPALPDATTPPLGPITAKKYVFCVVLVEDGAPYAVMIRI